jgi:GDP-mannose 6-dehydrogenase
MDISIFGLGYVGAVTSACLARDGHQVMGVDVNPEKVRLIASGEAPIIELGLTELIRYGIDSGRLRTTTAADEAVRESEISLIAVGTPSKASGALDLSHVHNVCEEIGRAIGKKNQAHTVVVRSTVTPGTTQRCREILRRTAGETPVHVACNPEFLREGSAIRDYDAPPYTVIGTSDPEAEKAVRTLYDGIDAPVHVVAEEIAEIVKAAANAWHATKIVFANEIGRLAKSHGVDGRRVMDLLKQDTKLNISAAYLTPGFAYGGSCLPKDVRALLAQCREASIEAPLLNALPVSNRAHIEAAEQLVRAAGGSRIGLVGLAFKPGTDDLRESPAVDLVLRLLAAECDVRIYDEAVFEATLLGSNKRFIEETIPSLPDLLLRTGEELLEYADVLVVTHGAARLRPLLNRAGPDIRVIDLAGLYAKPPDREHYDGSAW